MLCTQPPEWPTPALKELSVLWADTQIHKVNAVKDIKARCEVCAEQAPQRGIQRPGQGVGEELTLLNYGVGEDS